MNKPEVMEFVQDYIGDQYPSVVKGSTFTMHAESIIESLVDLDVSVDDAKKLFRDHCKSTEKMEHVSTKRGLAIFAELLEDRVRMFTLKRKKIFAITIAQPRASLIALGFKRAIGFASDEVKWLINEPLAIYAGRQVDPDVIIRVKECVDQWPKLELPRRALEWIESKPELPTESVIARSTITAGRWLGMNEKHLLLHNRQADTFGLMLGEEIEVFDPPFVELDKRGIWPWKNRADFGLDQEPKKEAPENG